MFLFYDNNGDLFSKPVISSDSVCEVLKGGAGFYRHDPKRERTVKALSRRGCRRGQVRGLSWPARGFMYEEAYGLSVGSAAGGS